MHQTAFTLVKSDRWTQRLVYDMSKFAAKVARALDHQSPKWIGMVGGEDGRSNCESTKNHTL